MLPEKFESGWSEAEESILRVRGRSSLRELPTLSEKEPTNHVGGQGQRLIKEKSMYGNPGLLTMQVTHWRPRRCQWAAMPIRTPTLS